MILVIAEQRDGRLNKASWESVAGAQQIARASSEPIVVIVPGANLQAVADELASAAVSEIVMLDGAALEQYTADGYTAALQGAIAELAPSTVVLPHTYQTRDF